MINLVTYDCIKMGFKCVKFNKENFSYLWTHESIFQLRLRWLDWNNFVSPFRRRVRFFSGLDQNFTIELQIVSNQSSYLLKILIEARTSSIYNELSWPLIHLSSMPNGRSVWLLLTLANKRNMLNLITNHLFQLIK